METRTCAKCGGEFQSLMRRARCYDCRRKRGKIGSGWIYAIEEGSAARHIKVGYSANPKARLVELQVGNPYELRFIGVWNGNPAQERALHSRFAKYRKLGEWFESAKPLRTFIMSVALPDLTSSFATA